MSPNVTSQTRLINPNPNNAKFDIGVMGINGFTGIVTISINAPTGVSGIVTNSPVLLGPPQTVLVDLYGGIPGNYTVTVIGTSGKISHSVSLTLVAQDIGFSANPNPLMLLHNGSSSTITLTSRNGFSGDVNINASYMIYKPPVSPATVYVPEGGTATATLTVSVPSPNPPSGNVYVVLSTHPAGLDSGEALYYNVYLMTNQSLTLQNYSFTSNTNATLYLKNNETFSINPSSYAVADAAGDQYIFNYSSLASNCCAGAPGGVVSPLLLLIGGGCPNCSLKGAPFVFSSGKSYTVTLTTSPGYEFIYAIKG